MTMMRLVHAFLALSVLATAATASQVQPVASSPSVQISVNVVDIKQAKGNTDAKQLEITVTNDKAEAIPQLTVQYWLFNKVVETKGFDVTKTASMKFPLGASASEVVKSQVAQFKYVKSKSSGSGTHATSTKASGTKYCGYGVSVQIAGKVVAEQFEPTEMKQIAETVAIEVAEEKAKKKLAAPVKPGK